MHYVTFALLCVTWAGLDYLFLIKSMQPFYIFGQLCHARRWDVQRTVKAMQNTCTYNV